ncbi:hypothetical protein [Terrihabitans rhizophilus]|uniref:Uncharacterized protein n=1 Tax=Terrihabitans rhizophilus TaxID=3092662 RepID=A0ABU4RP59_9HYPH|nr:hypothetical protein [Terrihabitans sp. PJ23]MDX6806612.1 hypothetical protein [Terrihabitans sp. PJ23]
MALYLASISAIIRHAAISERVPGGQEAIWPIANGTYRTDGDLVAVSFQNPLDVQQFVVGLIGRGLRGTDQKRTPDYVVVDLFQGPTSVCPWLDLTENGAELALMPSLRKPKRPKSVTQEVLEVRDVLWRHWNPLNVSPEITDETEYDDYIPGLIALKRHFGIRALDLQRYLIWMQSNWINQEADSARAYRTDSALLN